MEFLKFFKGVSVQQQYDMGEKIGTGKFSIVYACRDKKTNH
jgi:RIO-like serine/threonine protein kinase